ncbi:MAG: hypothetical protein JWO36_6292 [Myxococcales bacterium]|nr:hypothetical protein [Myxococcales bacterium]
MRAILAVFVLAACDVNMTPEPTAPPTLPSCVPNRDGQITAAELPIALGATVDYYTGANRTVDLAGKNGIWNFSEERADDTVVALGPIVLGAQWYAPQFPTGEFAVDGGGGLDGIYHQDDRGLWLDGTASRDPAPATKTLIRYAQPITVLRFPITDGQSFTVIGAIDGTISGLPFIGTDTVDVEVAGTGRLDVPYVQFSPVLRVRTHVARKATAGGAPAVQRRTTSFLFECFGEVTRADSKQDEVSPDFTVAASLRRFALGVSK